MVMVAAVDGSSLKHRAPAKEMKATFFWSKLVSFVSRGTQAGVITVAVFFS